MIPVSRFAYVNAYSALDLKDEAGGWLAHVVREMVDKLPPPVISPTCRKQGHKWGDPWEWGEDSAIHVRGCVRCARRGMVVVLTDYPEEEKT